MKKILPIITILIVLTACSAPQTQAATDLPAAEMPLVNVPNPASVFCTDNGNTLEIQTAADGSQSGVCVFPDGSSCDEWAYFRGECGSATPESPTPEITGVVTTETIDDAAGGYMAPGTSEEIVDWWGVIKSTEPGAQYDDYFERQDMGQVLYFGIDSTDQEVAAQIQTLRDTGKIVHLYGTLFSNVPDYNLSQIQVDRMVVEE